MSDYIVKIVPRDPTCKVAEQRLMEAKHFIESKLSCDSVTIEFYEFPQFINVLKGRKGIADIEKYLNWIPSEYIFDNIWVSCEESCGKNTVEWQNHFINMWKETDDNYWVTTIRFERKK